MINKSSDSLFELVRSMSQSEKRYLKQYAKRYSKNTKSNYYLILFNELDKLVKKSIKYDEAALKEKIKKEKWITQFAVTKSYLYDLILDSLRSCNKATTTTVEINELLIDSQNLFFKGLHSQALNRLRKARMICESLGHYNLLGEVNYWIKRGLILKEKYNDDDMKLFIDSQFNPFTPRRISEHLKLLDRAIEIQFFNRDAGYSMKTEQNRKKFIDKFFKDGPELIETVSDEPIDLLRLKYGTTALYYQFADNRKESAKHYQLALNLMERNERYLQDNIRAYISYTMGLSIQHYFLGNYVELQELTKKLKIVSDKNYKTVPRTVTSDALAHIININFSMDQKRGEFEYSVDEIDAGLEEWVKKSGFRSSAFSLLMYNIGMTHFMTQNFKKAAKAWNDLIAMSIKNNYLDNISSSRMMLCFAALEMKDEELLQSRTGSWKYFIETREMFFPAEKVVYKFFTSKRQMADLIEMKTILANILKENDSINDFFDIWNWIESKVNKTTFAEAVKVYYDQKGHAL